MTYEESDESWAKGKPGGTEGAESKRSKDLSEMRERMGNAQPTPRDEELFNKWVGDVDAGDSSPGTIDFVNAMLNEGGWSKEEGGEGTGEGTGEGGQSSWHPPAEPIPAGAPECEKKDCLGICNGPNSKDEGGRCCHDLERDCNGKCFGNSITIRPPSGKKCCDRTDPDQQAYCCHNPITTCNPACPKPGQIINGHISTKGCWCTPGTDEHCCQESQLDDSGRCPSSPQYTVWAYEVSGDRCNCNSVLASVLPNGTESFLSQESCEAACSAIIENIPSS